MTTESPAADPYSRSAVGLDIGGTKIAAAVVPGSGKILERTQVPTPQTGGETERRSTDLRWWADEQETIVEVLGR